jgi:hypothetical protein
MDKNFSVLLVLFLFLLFFPFASSGKIFVPEKSEKTPGLTWELKISLSSKGTYKIKMGKDSYDAGYSYKIGWTGGMERDGDDFLIYQKNTSLSHWELKEIASNADTEKTATLTMKDITEKPYFMFNYLLDEEKNVNINFYIEGFPIPLNKSTQKIYFHLPETKENSNLFHGIDYNLFVKKGINILSIEKRKIYRDTINKKFNWKWKHEGWLPEVKKPVFYLHNHSVEIEVTVTPKKNKP